VRQAFEVFANAAPPPAGAKFTTIEILPAVEPGAERASRRASGRQPARKATAEAKEVRRASPARSRRSVRTADATGAIATSAKAVSAKRIAHCSAKYRSYDPASDTYRGFGGRRSPCLPRA